MATVSTNLTSILSSNLTEYDKPIFSHISARAWRFDSNGVNSKWRTRGKGSITIYYNIKINKAKLLFFDEKYQKVRLLQYIDNACDTNASISSSDSTTQSVQWIGNDFTMDPLHPLQSQWKLKFAHSKQAARKFMILYNYHIALFNKYLNKNEFLEEQTCYICYDFIHESKLLFCGHIGCNSCITEWIESSKHSDHGPTCPKCRSRIANKPIACLTMDHIIQFQKESYALNLRHICICCEPYHRNDRYIGCDYCDHWYHPRCVGLKRNELERHPSKYKCPLCISKESLSRPMEEHETLMAEVPIKAIYRWDEDISGQPCWKKRVIDTKLQFLHNTQTGKQRMIARDYETNKLKLDQFIYDYYRDTLQIKSKKSVLWIAMDSVLQKEYNKHERVSFAAKFYTEKDALDFKLYYSNRRDEHHRLPIATEEGQSVISESVISELSRLPDIKQVHHEMTEDDRKLQDLFMDEYHANIDEKEHNEISMAQSEGIIMEEREHSEDVYEEWKYASIIAMKETVKSYHAQPQVKRMERSMRNAVQETKRWMDTILCGEFKSSEDMNTRAFVLNDANIERGLSGIYDKIDGWNGVNVDTNIICFNSYWKMASNYLHQWCGDYYFYPIIAYLQSYCHEICERFELNVEDLYLLQCIHALLTADEDIYNNNNNKDHSYHPIAWITDGIIHHSQKLQSQFECIGDKHHIEWSKYIRNNQIKDCCVEWIEIILRKIKMDLLIAMYMNHGGKQWNLQPRKRDVHLNQMVRLRSGHIGKVVWIHEMDDTECTHCEVHRMCAFGATIFIGLILNEWDYYGHDGHFGCAQWFQSPKGKGLIVPLVFLDCVLDDNGEEEAEPPPPQEENKVDDGEPKPRVARVPAIKIVNTMCSELQQKLELLPIDEQREWFNAQVMNPPPSLPTNEMNAKDKREHHGAAIELGDRVRTQSGKFGYVKYIGDIAPNPETMYGLELDNMIFPGNNGTFNGVQYFTAASGRGYFTIKSDIVKVRHHSDHVLGENCVIVTNVSPVTGYHDLMEWLQTEKLASVQSVDVYKRNGLIEGVVQFGDEVDFKYILSNLNGEKLGDRYVTVFDTKECRDAVMCLNCNTKGHLIKDCPNSIEYSETAEWSQWTVEEKSTTAFTATARHQRGITIYEPNTQSEVQFAEDVSLTVNDIDPEPAAHSVVAVDESKHDATHSSEIKVSNLPRDFDHVALEGIFKQIDGIKRFDRRNNVVFIEYDKAQSAMEAVRKYEGMKVNDCAIHVECIDAKHNPSNRLQPPRLPSITSSSSAPHHALSIEHVPLSMTSNDDDDRNETYSNFVKRMTREALLEATDQDISTQVSSPLILHESVIHPPPVDLNITTESKRQLKEDNNGEFKLYILNIPTHMTLEDIMQQIQLLSQTEIQHVHRTPYCCTVTYHSAQDALKAKNNLQNAKCDGAILIVEQEIRCAECQQEWHGNERMVQCHHSAMRHCNAWFHAKCVFQTDSDTNCKKIFVCKQCNTSSSSETKHDAESEEKTTTHAVYDTERYLYCIDIQSLYRWVDNDWKMRVQHTKLEFYQNKESKKIRITARDPVSFKLRLNHWIPPLTMCQLQRQMNAAHCWQWNAFDATVKKEEMEQCAANSNPPQYLFCAKFKNDTDTNKFYEMFIDIQKKNARAMHRDSVPNDIDIEHKDDWIDTKWSAWKQRELIKLQSLATLQWDYIGKLLKESVDSCKLQWTMMMKRSNVIKHHMNVIRQQSHDGNVIHDADPNILDNVYYVLNTNQWDADRLDALWNNIIRNQRKRISMDTTSHPYDKISLGRDTNRNVSIQGEWDIFVAENSSTLNALQQNKMNVDELKRLKQFYALCLNNPQNVENTPHDFKGDEALNFVTVDTADTHQLEHIIKDITQRISDLSKGFTTLPTEHSLEIEAEKRCDEISEDDHDTFSMQSHIIIPINGRITIQMHPIGYGLTMSTHSSTSITAIKSILSQKLGVDLYHATVMNEDKNALEDSYSITDYNIQHNLVLHVTVPALKYGDDRWRIPMGVDDDEDEPISKTWTVTTVVGNIELAIELTEQERHTLSCVHDLKQKLFSVCNVGIPKQELFIEDRMLTDTDRLKEVEARCHDIRLLYIADESDMPLFVKYNDTLVFICLDKENDPLSVIPLILNVSNVILLTDEDGVALDPTKSVRAYGNVLEAESVIRVVDNTMIHMKIYCMCVTDECIEIQMRKSQTIRELKHRILRDASHHRMRMDMKEDCEEQEDSKDDIKFDDNDAYKIGLDDVQIFSYLQHKDLREVAARLSHDNMYRLIMNNAPNIYENDAKRLCDEYFYDGKLLFCTIKMERKIKILFPKYILPSRIKSFTISSFEPYLTLLYEFVSEATKIELNDIMLYCPDLQKHIAPEWSGERLIAEHYAQKQNNNYVVLYFMHIPGVIQRANPPPKMVSIYLIINDAFYCKQYHNRKIPFMVNVHDSIATLKRDIHDRFPFFGALQLLKNSMLRMDGEDSTLLSDYDLRSGEYIEVCSVYPNIFEVYIQSMVSNANEIKFTCNVTPHDTVKLLKDKIMTKAQQCVIKMMFMGRELEDSDQTMVEYCIRQHSTIHVVFKSA